MFADFEDNTYDVRRLEIQALQLIFEEATFDVTNFSGTIHIEIKEKWIVYDGAISQEVDYLPSFKLTFTLPDGYPDQNPPQLSLRCPIFTANQLNIFYDFLISIWENHKDQIIYSCVDYLQHQIQDNLKDILDCPLQVSTTVFHQVVSNNESAKRGEFDLSSFECGICQDTRSGSICTQFECTHVFCNPCLVDYFSTVIAEGNVTKVHCPSLECTKLWADKMLRRQNTEGLIESKEHLIAFVEELLTPTLPLTLLDSLLTSPKLVRRYQELHRQHLYEIIAKLLPNALVECPRVGCDERILRHDRGDLLVQCSKCHYAFCFNCKKLWHAKYLACKPAEGGEYGVPISEIEIYQSSKKDSHERKILHSRYGHLVMIRALKEFEMDKLFTKLLQESSDCSQCPSCDIVIQKSDGCNLMTCVRCHTKFCFICGFITGASHDHFADPSSTCYRKLFHGMPGIDDLEDAFIHH